MAWMTPMMAAAAQKQQDEKLLAELISKDTAEKYEFKILRGYPGAFRKPERLQTVLEEERRSQWEMILKLDDERLVMRRPRRSPAYDTLGEAGTDPYRTQIGVGRIAIKITAILGVLLLGGVVALLYAGNPETAVESTTWPSIAIALVVGLLVVLLAVLKRIR